MRKFTTNSRDIYGRLSFHLIPCGSRDYALRIARALCSYNLCACVHAYITYNIPLMLVQWFLPLVHSPFLGLFEGKHMFLIFSHHTLSQWPCSAVLRQHRLVVIHKPLVVLTTYFQAMITSPGWFVHCSSTQHRGK